MDDKIYDLLVDSDDEKNNNYIGIVAYSLYQKQKKEFIKKTMAEKSTVTDIEMETFINSVSTDAMFNLWQKEAGQMLIDLTYNVTNENIKSIISDNKTKFWNGVKQSMLASFLYSIILIIIGLLISTNISLESLLKNYIKENISEKKENVLNP